MSGILESLEVERLRDDEDVNVDVAAVVDDDDEEELAGGMTLASLNGFLSDKRLKVLLRLLAKFTEPTLKLECLAGSIAELDVGGSGAGSCVIPSSRLASSSKTLGRERSF